MEQTIFLEALNKKNPWNRMQNLSRANNKQPTANNKDHSEWNTSTLAKAQDKNVHSPFTICNCSESLIQQDPKG